MVEGSPHTTSGAIHGERLQRVRFNLKLNQTCLWSNHSGNLAIKMTGGGGRGVEHQEFY